MERKKVFEFLEAKLGDLLLRGVFSEDLSLTDDLGLDSLDMIDFLMQCEKEFNSRVPDDVAERITTVGELIDAICKYEQS